MKYSKDEVKEAEDFIKSYVNEGDTIYHVLANVSKTGITRKFSFYVLKNNKPISLTKAIAVLLGLPFKDCRAVVKGCGSDMAFMTIHDVSKKLFGDGYYLTVTPL